VRDGQQPLIRMEREFRGKVHLAQVAVPAKLARSRPWPGALAVNCWALLDNAPSAEFGEAGTSTHLEVCSA
jgi:hypothetical protein